MGADSPPPPARLPWRSPAVLAALATIILLAAWLLLGPKPWNDGVAAAEAKGRAPKTLHLAVTGLWYGALVALPFALALVPLTRRMHSRPQGPPRPIQCPVPPAKAWLPIGLAALGIAAILAKDNHHRLDQSLWDDEEKALRYFTVGRCLPDKQGEIKFTATTWLDVFFNYRQPNNHIFFTALSKASHEASGHAIDTPGQPYFSERALRLPAFFAGLLAIGALGVSLTLLGHPKAGLWAMPLLALHPWFLRYLVEARGYSLVLLLGPLTLACLYRALAGGRTIWWAGAGLGQFLLLWTYPGSVHFVFWMNIGALSWMLFAPAARPWRAHHLPRWLATNLWSAIVFIVLMAPAVPQLIDYLREHRDTIHFTGESARNLAALLFAGSTWKNWDPANPLALGLNEILAGSPLSLAAALATAAAMLAGLVFLLRRSSIHAWLLPAMLLPAVSFPIHAWLKDHPFYTWYAVGVLPFLLALAGFGIEAVSNRLREGNARHLTALALGLLLVFGYAQLTSRQRAITMAHPVEPKRDSFLLYRAAAPNPFEPGQSKIITIGFHQENRTYDPALRLLDDTKNQEAIDEVIAEADRTGKPLFVDFAQESYAREHFGKIFQRLDDPNRFERIAVLPGLEPQNTRVVLRYLPTAENRAPAPPSPH